MDALYGQMYGIGGSSFSFEQLIEKSISAFHEKFGYKAARVVVNPVHENLIVPEGVELKFNAYVGKTYLLLCPILSRTPIFIVKRSPVL